MTEPSPAYEDYAGRSQVDQNAIARYRAATTRHEGTGNPPTQDEGNEVVDSTLPAGPAGAREALRRSIENKRQAIEATPPHLRSKDDREFLRQTDPDNQES